MRAARPRQNRVQCISHESHISHAANEAAKIWRSLTGGQAVNDCAHSSIWRHFQNARGKPTGVRSHGGNDLIARSGTGHCSTCATLSDVEIAIRAKCQATRIIETCGEQGHVRRLCEHYGRCKNHENQRKKAKVFPDSETSSHTTLQ